VEGITLALSLQPFYVSCMNGIEGNVLGLDADEGPMICLHLYSEEKLFKLIENRF
jgi:hypothetical protein